MRHLLLSLLLIGCSSRVTTEGAAPVDARPALLDEAHAVQIAREDAIIAYRSLEPFAVDTRLEGEVWRVEFRRTDGLDGGAPRYRIDARSGKILEKRYSQ